MRPKLFLLFVMSVVCLFPARAQTVNEKESSIVFKDTAAEVSIVVENPAAAFDTKAELELLDQKSVRRADSSQNFRIKRGKGVYKMLLPVGDLLKTAENDMPWYRLHYRVGAVEGVISMSELFTDIFELRMAAPENVYPGMNYRVRVRAIQPFTKTAVKNVKIDGEFTIDIKTDSDEDEDELKLTAKGETDGKGFANLDFKIPESVKLDRYADGDVTITGRKRGIVREIDGDLDSNENRGSVFLMADKPLYQPGQDFNIRGIYLDANNFVVANTELEFEIEDEDDTVLYRETVKTSDFGVAAISWKIPENAKLGNYKVTVDADDDELRRHEMNFKVSRYDLPNFSVAAKADKAFYLPSDKTAGIAVTADYLFGKPVKKGHVRVVQESDRRWNWKEQKYEAEEKQVFEGETDGQGKYIASIDLSDEMAKLDEEKWKRFQDLKFAAYFTDLDSNRTEQKRLEIRLTKEPIHIYFLIYSRNNPNLPVKGYISTFYADGTVAMCDVAISNKGKRVARLKTNSLGAGRFEFDIPPGETANESYDLQILAEDKKGQTGTFSEQLRLDKEDVIVIETDKTVYNPGDNIDLRLLSTQKSGYVYVDIVKGWSVIESHFVNLKNGKGDLRIPYNKDFKGDLTIGAYTDENDGYDESMRASRGIIFPEQQNLKLDAKFSSDTYRPNEEGKIRFSVLDGNRQAVQGALGVVIFDKAIEERARTDAEFGSYFSGFYGLMGYEKGFGSLTLKDLNDLDLSQPVTDEMQLAAEVMLAGNYYYPRISHSNFNQTEAQGLYAEYFKKQLDPVGAAVKNEFERSGTYPWDMASLRKILGGNGIDFDSLRDPWGEKYIASFSTDKTRAFLNLKTAGADKTPDTPDDFEVSRAGLLYFTPAGKKMDAAVLDFHARTGGYIKDLQTLETEAAKQGLVLKDLKDRWGRAYLITFEIEEKFLVIRFHSNGENGVFDPKIWNTDDFDIWTSRINYFADTEAEIMQAIGSTLKAKKAEAPHNEAEFRHLLIASGIDLEKVRDIYNEKVYITSETRAIYADNIIIEDGKQKITPVTQHLITFRLRSMGEDRTTSGDDFDLTTFSSDQLSLLREREYSTGTAKDIIYTGASGAIHGTVTDPNGAVVPGARAVATSETDETRVFTTETNAAGEFLLENLPSGRYSVSVSSPGFQNYKYQNIQVRAMNLVEMKVYLNVANVSETVAVTAEGLDTVETSNSQLATTVTRVPARIAFPYAEKNSTPRLREYFPETLVWNPELLTDKNGKAEMKFKLADNITTWKMYSIASTKKGKIGIAEKEITAFQPFFVDLDPPKFLTSGDEISLPVQVRNYTEKKQKVDIGMAKADWFSFLGQDKQQVDVNSGDSQNAVFGFKAIDAVKDGKQRVTAIAQGDSDAIEKPVTVRPDGEEIVKTDTIFFKEAASVDVDFPANILAKTQKAELKIYPNLFSHVAESVEGLLQRPYGCGEQTISSTYPNLMVLKFTKEDNKLRQTAQKYLKNGYERLRGYQVADGGFTYWGGKDTSDVALTAYALRFLNDAKGSVEVDDDIIKNARDWLIKQQRDDGSWTKTYAYETAEDTRRTKLVTSYVARTLAMMKEKDTSALQKALAYLKTRNAEIDEPYAMALYGLASLDAGNAAEAAAIAAQLEKMAIAEGNSVYWKLETNTPFYGWGTAGRLETTALVLQLLIREGKPDAARTALIAKGTIFLLGKKDRYGVWYSTQTTINVLDAFLAALAPGNAAGTAAETIQVMVNGAVVQILPVPAGQITPLSVDLRPAPGANRVEIKSTGASSIMAQVVQTHYIDWSDSESAARAVNRSGTLKLDYKCDKTSAAIMQDIGCSVEVERIGFRGYGMLLAEIGTPPGADVSRESLQEAMNTDWSFSRYDILPDRIIVYMWAKAGGTKFNFKFRPRYGINAQTPASTVYDYYNPEAKATAVPIRFTVK